MSVLRNILGRIFGRAQASAPTAPSDLPTPAAAPVGPAVEPQPQAAPTEPAKTSPAAPVGPAVSPQPAPEPMASVDLEKVMEEKAAQAGQKLNWRTSIVDLMKLLGIDSGLEARKELARELGYTGDMSDSATMNIWLHKQVMKKVAENGGEVPASLRD